MTEKRSSVERVKEYDISQVQIPEGPKVVRKRPGMYIGSIDSEGLHHLVWEIVDNSIDEVLTGFATKIYVIIEKDNSITVIDDGRGIPVDIQAKTGRPAVETVFTILHARGKFDGGGYKVSGGLHRVESSVVNALSTQLDTRVYREGNVYYQEYRRGAVVDDLKIIEQTDRHGTTVHFTPDLEIFTETTEFDFSRLATRIRELTFLNRGMCISIEDKREEEPVINEYHYDSGIKSYVEYLNANKTVIFPEPVYLEGEQQDIAVEVSMQYTDGYHSNIMSFANNIHTYKGGTHELGFKTALTRVINDYARKQKLMKENDDNLTGEDMREGLVAVISIKHPDPQFEGQIKTKLGNLEVRTVTDRLLSEHFMKFLLENPNVDRQIVEKGLLASRACLAAKHACEVTRRKGALETSNLPGKLADCSSSDPEKRELFIAEGDSAGGSAKQGRNREFQATLSIHGKILNVEKASMDEILANEEIRSLFTAVGTRFGEDFDVSKTRYYKLVIMADADVDGAHIRTLLLTLFYCYIRPIAEAGYVYIAQPPLYGVEQGKNVTYVQPGENAEEELERVVASLPASPKPSVQRYERLGEMDDHQPWETAMDPSSRMMARVSVGDVIVADQIFEMLMGDRVEPRRAFIEENAHYVKNLDI